MYEIAICEVCKRTFRKDTMHGSHASICADCAKPLPTPPKVDFYELADEPDALKPKPKKCRDCGDTYMGCGASKYCPSCRRKHEEATALRQAERRREMKGVPKSDPVCIDCGHRLPNRRYKYCADCASRHAVERAIAWRLAHKDEINAAQRAKYHARKEKEVQPSNEPRDY